MNIISNLQRTGLIQRRRKTNDTTVYLSLQKNLWKQVPPNSTQHDGSYKVIIGVTGVSLFRHRVQLRPVGGKGSNKCERMRREGVGGRRGQRVLRGSSHLAPFLSTSSSPGSPYTGNRSVRDFVGALFLPSPPPSPHP